MALHAKLELRQGQTLVMTPQLQQAIKLLQLSNLELAAYVEGEIERNPLLEREDGDEGVAIARDAEPVASGAEPAVPEIEAADSWLERDGGAIDPAGDLDTSYDNVDPDASRADREPEPGAGPSPWSSIGSGVGSGGDGDANLEEYVASERTLHDHLREQLGVAIRDDARHFIGLNLIDMVDEAGYLRGDLEALAERLEAPLPLVEETLAILQRFDPPGVFARTLAECLALQLREQNRYDPVIARLLDNLHLLASHNLSALRRECDVDNTELTEMIGEIRALNPKPGLGFGHIDVQTAIPDVYVLPTKEGGWRVELNSETLPRVLVNQTYLTVIGKGARAPEAKGYLQDCLQSANWLVRSLDQRARTILKVADEIVRQQDAFLTYGIQHLRPLNLKTIAEAIGMHESTVSRVTSNKFMATNRGLFELKYFFTSAIASAGDGEAHSSESVRFRIKQLIDAETAEDVLSDDRLVVKLREDGIDIARRTVAKYREALNIASSVDRRRKKRLAVRIGI